MRNRVEALIAVFALLAAGCSPEAISPDGENQPNANLNVVAAGPFQVSGAITGPGGVNICPLAGGAVGVRLYRPDGTVATPQQSICVASGLANTYSLIVPGGTYYLRVALPTAAVYGPAPLVLRSLDLTPLEVTADLVRDFQIPRGLPLGGGVTLDGVSVNSGNSFNLYHGELQQSVTATSAFTMPTGAWWEAAGRSPVYLQDGASYRMFYGCEMLGADMATPPPAGPLVFPAQFSSLSCDFTSNDASTRTHFNNRLVVTAEAGDFGAQSPEQVALRGRGWGAQFPVGPGGPVHYPVRAKQLYRGGLVLGMAPDKELSATNMFGYNCGPACADFDVSAPPEIGHGPLGKVIHWHYSDAISPETEGLEVDQWSYDAAGDYVLFHFVIRNTTRQSKSFGAGVFMDWDMGSNTFDDQVWTDWGGALMATADPAGGSHFGTLMLGTVSFSNYAYGSTYPVCDGEAPVSRRVAALLGTLRATERTRTDCDKRYIHGWGPIVLAPGHQAAFGMAVLAGDHGAGLRAAAEAASSDWRGALGNDAPWVLIDITPGSTVNPINTRAHGLVPVVIFGGYGYRQTIPDVTQIDFSRLVFGPGGASEAHDLNDPIVLADHLRDVNGDGYADLTTHFPVQATGLTAGVTEACVNGMTHTGNVFNGCDAVTVR